ncbi:helix-turn-helix domain-containing protein [Herbaspirillum rubrisubalbicans]|uniref:helix-turn-helix domain-containing protein n=1 Tax=Herbaspirillum rubrisubalbicans TaxID=80842 RepID=UPI001558F5D6|nr:helix-turn-helix transcriptional regulator [Herbaspirillum rubrisubalbicans]NQE50067.1 Cro/Cl family transcriptional regulator [Herbaspirillum rubrisubalbicans]
MNSDKLAIGQRIRLIRVKMGISQRLFARALETAPNHICQIERGRCVPGSKLLHGMRAQFGIDLNWLLSGQSALTTTLLKREIKTLVADYQRADADGKALLMYTASFLVEGREARKRQMTIQDPTQDTIQDTNEGA